MPYLDKEERFYDYHTSDVEGSDIFDTHKASNSDAQQILDGSTYWKDEKNTISKIVYMTPYEYFKACAEDCFDETAEQLIASRGRDKYTLDHLTEVIKTYKKRFPIPYINYATHSTPSQEGLHRMYVAGELFGWDTKFPVQIIEWADKEKAIKDKEDKHVAKILRYINKAIDRALRYKYYNIDELKIQLQDELEDEFRYVDEFEDEYTFELLPYNKSDFEVVVNDKYRALISAEDINFISETTDQDVEDLDLDDLSDWMKDLLKDIDVEKTKLTERYADPEAFLVSHDLDVLLKKEFGEHYSSSNRCKDVCEFVKSLCPGCELLSFMIGVWKYIDEPEIISNKGHCVIRFKNKIYDFTSHQYDDYGIEPATSQPRVLEYDKDLSKAFECNVYRDKDYLITVL